MRPFAITFHAIARCEDVSTSSGLGREKPLHPRRHKPARDASARLNMRQPDHEQRRWKAEADALGITLTAYVRAKVNGTEVKVIRVTDPALLNEVRRIGNNINQTNHGMHAGWPVDRRTIDGALAAVAEVLRRILQELA